MEVIKQNTKINFVGYMPYALLVSALLIAVSLVGFFFWPKVKWGIDFSGGAEFQVIFKEPVPMGKVREAVESLKLGETKVQEWKELGASGGAKYLIRVEKLTAEKEAKETAGKTPPPASAETAKEGAGGGTAGLIQEKFAAAFGADSFELLKSDYVGPKVGKELRNNGIMAVGIACLLMLVYITLRFEFRYAVGAVLALLHDSLISTGALVWTNRDFNLTLIAALLTIVGYSVNDTIVVFDRIRENVRRQRRLSLDEVINASINQTLSRTLLTSFVTALAVFFLWLFGQGDVHHFAFLMLVGIVVGTYSSIYVASAVVVFWERLRAEKRSPAAETKSKNSS